MTELRLDPRNARRHSDRNKRQIKQSLETVGAGRSILADADGIVRAGNGVFAEWGDKPIKIVETDGKELVVVQRTDLRGQDAIRAAALDNLVADSSAFDYDAAILAEIARDDDVIRAIANEDAKLIALLGQELAVQDPMQEWQGMPEHRSEEIRDTAICCLVRFRTVEDREAFEKFLGWKLHHKNNTYTTWYPKQDFDQLGRGMEFVSES